MARDLFEEAGIQYGGGGGGGGGRDLFAEAGIQATPKPSDATKKGFWGSAGEIASDLGKRISGSAIHGVAAIPLGIEQGVKGGIRNAVTGGADVVMPAGIYSPGLDTDESLFGPETDEQKARRKLKAEEAVSAIPSIPGSAWLERKGKQAQEAINKTTSEATQRAVENSQVTGNIFKGEIDFGADPSVRGFVMQASDVFGTMLPSLVTTLITKNPAIGGVVGGGQAASEGAVEARDFIEGKTHEQLLKESPFYAQMLKGGATPAQARKLTADRGAETAALFQGIVGGAGDAVTGKLITGQLDDLIGKVAGKSIVARGVAGGVLSSAEQGSQEVGEGVAADIGMKSVVRSKEVGEGSAGNFVLGALGGVGPGSAQGVRSAVGERMAARQAKAGDTLTYEQAKAATEAAPAPAPTASPAESPQAAQRPQATTQQPGGRGQFDYAAYDAYRTTLESGGRADAKATTSSATGLHQFTDKAWLNTVKSAKPAWANGLTDAQVLALRTDPDKSTEMVRVLDNENATRLQGAKQPVTVHNLYAAHHFGSGRAIDFAKAGDNVLMNNILTPAQIKANSYLDGKTKAEAIAIWDRRAAKAGVKVDGSAAMDATPTQQEQAAPDPIADQPVHSPAEAEAEAAPAATQEAAASPERVAEIDEETAALERRQKKLQDAEYGAIFDTEREAIAQELADLRRERDDLFAQKLMPEPAAEVAQPAPMVAPKPTAPIQSEAAALQARQQQTGTEPVLQNRDRATKASIDQMNAIAANPDYMMAGVSRSMDTGAPVVVGSLPASATLGRTETVVDGKRDRIQTQYAVVEAGDVLTSNAADGTPNADYAIGQQGKVRAVAGNARSAGLIAGYERGTTGNYRSELEADAEAHGIPAEVIRGMTNPVLVRVMNAADLKQDAGDRSNIGAGARLSPAEEAANDARRVGLAAIEFDDDGMPRANSVLGFVQAMPVTERNAMLMKDGRPSKQAVDRLMAATFRAAYGSDALTELYAAAQDQEARTVMAGIARSAGAMAKLEGTGEYDIRGLVTEAAQMAVNAVRSGKKLSDWARNLDLDMSPAAAEVARFFADNIRSANRIAEGLREWAGLALEQALAVEQNEAGPGMFGDIPTLTREQLIERLNNATDQQTDLADAGGPVAAAQDTEGRTPGRRREGSGQEDGRVDRAEVPQEAAQVAVQEGDQVDGAARSEAAVTAHAFPSVQRSEGATAATNDADGNDEIAGLARSIEQAYAELKRLQADRRKARGDSRQAITERIERLKQGIADYEALLLDMRRQAAVADFKGAMADLADIATKHQRAAVVPESAPDLMPTLVRLFDAAIRIVGTDVRAATRWVQAQLRANPDTKKLVNRIEPMTYRKAAEQAVAAAGDAQGGLFTSIGEADAAFAAAQSADLRNRASLEGSPVEDGRMAINFKSPESSNRNQRPSGKPTYASPPNDSSKTQPGGNLSGTFMGSPDAPIVGGKGPGVDGAVSDKTAPAADDALRQRFTLPVPMFGDVPYRASAPVDAGGAEVLSSRVIVASTKLTKRDVEVLGLSPGKTKVYAWRVSVVSGPYGVHSIIEAMDADHGRSSDGEVLARFKEVSNAEHVERVAPAVARAARADFAAQAQELESYTSDDLRQRDNERQQADAAEQRQRQDDARRAQADAERGEFTLTGSDRAVDVAEAHGQQTMFSRARTPAQPRNLVTLHNLTVDNLLHADNIGGLPVPSLGITKVDSPFNGFGDITLIGPRGMIDPESGVPVFDRDAYTGRFPEMNYKRPKTKAAEALYNRMTAARELGGDGQSFVSQLWDSIRNNSAPNPRKLADLFERNRAPRLLYAREMLGKEIKAPMREQYRRYPFSTDKQLLAHIRKDRQARREGAERTQEQHDQARAELSRQVMAAIQRFEDGNAAIKESGIADDFREEMFDENGLLLARAEGSIERDAETVGVKVVDEDKLEAAIRKVVPRDDAGYQAWVKALVDPLFEPPTITLRGREVEPTLDNLVAAMAIGRTRGAEKTMASGTGKTAAMLGKQFKSIADIQAARDQVVSEATENEAKKTNEQVLNDYQNAVLPFFKYKNWKGEVDTWAGLDAAMEALADAGKRGSTDAAIRQALSKQGFTGVDQAIVNLARQSIDALRNTPTNYFEAKPQRAVGLDEFRGAVVPRGTDPRALAVLAKHGIEVVEHGKGEGARDKAIATLSKKLDKAGGDVLFSRAGEGGDPESQRQYREVERIRMSRDGAAAQQRSMPVADLQTMTDRVAKALPNMPRVHVLQSTRQAPEALLAYLEKQGAMDDAEGAFHRGELYLFADNLASMERAEHVLATHEAGHAGLAGMLGADKARVLQALLNRNDNLFRQAQAEAKRLKVPLLTAVEEVLVDMKPADLVKLDGWRKVAHRVQRWLERSGFTTLAKQMRQWMEGRLTDQQQADMLAADLMFAAHDYLAGRDQRLFTLDGRQEAAAAALSRSEATRRGYERRIDELFAWSKPRSIQPGQDAAVVLDQSDALSFLGFSDGPVFLDEKAVLKPEKGMPRGTKPKHPNMTAEQWKKVPDWLDNPAAVFDSDTVDGDLVAIAPELADGSVVLMTIAPTAQGQRRGTTISLLTNAYDKDGGPPPVNRWLREGKAWYIDQKAFPDVMRRGGVQSPATAHNKPGMRRILTEKQFDGWRRANPPLLSRATTPQPGAQGQQAQPATTVAVRAKARLQSLISPERVDAFIYGVQDKLIDLKRLRAHIQELGGTVNDLNDAYLGEELYHGRVARRSAAFLENEVAPLMKELRSEGYTIQQLEQYLHARHAPEANRVLAERNPNEQMIDAKLQEARTQVRDLERQLQRARAQGTSVVALEKALELAKEQEAVWKSAEPFRGTEEERLSLSGMSDADAAAHMAGLSRRDARRLALIAEKVDAIQKGTTDALVDYGLHDQETIDAWRDTYQHYVPLHRDEAHEDAASHPIGQGFSVRGEASKRRVGSNEKVTNILSHVVMQREAAITRGEKNHVAKQLYLMARQNPAPEWWSTDKAPRKRTVDKATGLVHTTVDPQYRTRENAVVARIAGREVAVVFNERNERAMRLARALKNLDGSDLPFLLNMSAKVTRYFSAINTQYNPVFGVVNFTRDTQAVLLNMESAGIAGGRVAMMRTLGSTYRAIWREARGKTPTNQSWLQLWDQLREDGGTTGYRELFAVPEDRAKALQRELTRDDASAPVKAGRAVLKLLEDYNDSMENATRLAVYKVALDRGMSRQQAASVAKNITVNFNRKGANSRHLGSLYAFFNAAVQGMARMVQTLRGPNGKKIMLGGVALGAMNTMLGYMMMGGGDDQDDEWSRIPEFVKVNSIVLPTSRTNYVAIPMPLGFNMFPNLGRIATEWAMGIGNKGGGERSLEMLGAIIDAFNPLGGGGNIPQVLAPTVLDPALALLQNRDWKNQPVFQEDFNSMDPTPGHQRVKESASAFSRAAAKGINSATGGTDFMPGAWSPTPDQLDFVIGQITGGVGRESLKLMQAVGAQFTGDELPAHKVPLVGRFSGSTTGPSGGAGQFYDNIRRLNTLENELIGRNRAGEDTTSLYRENPETALIPEGKMAYNQVSRLRKDRIREREEKRDGYQDVIKSIDEDIDLYMRELNRNMGSRAIREAGRAAAR